MSRSPPIVAVVASPSRATTRAATKRALGPTHDRCRGSFRLPICCYQIGVPRAFAQRRHCVSTPSLTPVATGTTSVFGSAPVIRFQQAIDIDLAVADLERRVRRLGRQLSPVPPTERHTRRRAARSSWWPNA
jgi:hypothetical protein